MPPTPRLHDARNFLIRLAAAGATDRNSPQLPPQPGLLPRLGGVTGLTGRAAGGGQEGISAYRNTANINARSLWKAGCLAAGHAAGHAHACTCMQCCRQRRCWQPTSRPAHRVVSGEKGACPKPDRLVAASLPPQVALAAAAADPISLLFWPSVASRPLGHFSVLTFAAIKLKGGATRIIDLPLRLPTALHEGDRKKKKRAQKPAPATDSLSIFQR